MSSGISLKREIEKVLKKMKEEGKTSFDVIDIGQRLNDESILKHSRMLRILSIIEELVEEGIVNEKEYEIEEYF